MKKILSVIGASALLTLSGCNWMKQEEKTEDVQAQVADANDVASDLPADEGTSDNDDDDDALLSDTSDDMPDDAPLMGPDDSAKRTGPAIKPGKK